MNKLNTNGLLIDKVIIEKISAYFWISILFNKYLESYIDPEIEYVVVSNNHNAFKFWENTQYNIYHSFSNQRESLMGILFNEINKKINIHFESWYSSEILERRVSVVNQNDDIMISIIIPNKNKFNDYFIYNNQLIHNIKNIPINDLINHGYDNAEKKTGITANKIIESTLSGILSNDIIKKTFQSESSLAVERLFRMLIGFGLPTKEISHKKFSILTTEAYKDSNKRVISNGGLFIIWQSSTNLQQTITSKEYYKLLLNVAIQSSNLTTNRLLEFSNKKSIISAKAAIMSRNMSHNLGSHYIANTKNYISNIARVKNDQDLRGLSHLLQYIQERMDYIATVISNDVYPLGALNFKSQIFDELTIDDCGERHGKDHLTTNFLLKYIVFSEKYSRTDNNSPGLKDLILEVFYPEADSEVKVFTGTQQLYREETSLKLELSKLNIAVPCGVMARHALFNIIENIIRNSAKHNRSSAEDLKIRIALKIKNAGKQLEISIHDNKGEYETLIGENKDGTVAKRLKSIRFLEQDGSGLNKENKGLKEMIISALWLKNEDVGEVMSKIDSIVDGEKKYKLITEKCLQIKNEGGNLAYILTLPIFKEVEFINNSFKPNDLKCVCADVIVGNEDKSAEFDKPFDDIFTRYLIANDAVNSMTEVEKLKKTIYDNLHVDVDKCEIYIDANREVINYKGNNVYAKLPSAEMNDKQICFITHFDSKNDSDKKEFINKYKDVAYLDSISGENFTSTIIAPEFLNDEYLKCKVIESALTKIAIIDERIYEKFAKSDKQKQMSKEKGVRSFVDNSACTVSSLIEYLTHNFPSLFAEEKDLINNLLKEEKKEKRIDESDVDIALNILFPGDLDEKVLKKRGIFIYTMEQNVDNDTVLKSISGRESKLGNKEKLAVVHFLSIHLGLIEKYKNSGGVKKLMDNIKDLFPNVKYIAIHSGRGNFSADLSTELKDYSFITLSALEAAINNSKYMLSQLFYNMNYYGKGNLNND